MFKTRITRTWANRVLIPLLIGAVLLPASAIRASSAESACPVQTVALSGTSAAEPILHVFSSPSISATGEVAFVSHNGAWSWKRGQLSCMKRHDDPMPARVTQVCVCNGGDVVVNYGRLWCGNSEGLRQIAAPSLVAPGTGGARFLRVVCGSCVANPAKQIAFLANLERKSGSVDDANDEGLWAGTPDALQLVARKGGPAPGLPRRNYARLGYPVINEQGKMAFWAVSGSERDLVAGIWAGTPGSLTLVVHGRQSVPGAPNGAPLLGLRDPSINRSGQVLFSGGNGDTGIWLATPGETPKCVVSKGMPAPGTEPGAAFKWFGPSTFNDRGDVVFQAGLQRAGPQPLRRERGVWALHEGKLHKLVRESDPEPNSLGNDCAYVEDNDMVPIINDQGTIVLKIYKANKRTLLAFNSSGDLLRMIQSEVTPLDLGAGNLRVPSDMHANVAWGGSPDMPFSLGSNGQDGRNCPLNDANQLAFLADFEGPPMGVFVTTVGDPGTADLAPAPLGIAFSALLVMVVISAVMLVGGVAWIMLRRQT